MTLWQGRISTGMADTVAAFTVSLPFDQLLAPDDIAGSRAHVKGLGQVGLLTADEVETLLAALDAFIAESQRHVTGEVRLRFAAPGTCTVVGRRSPVALYDHGLATYDSTDTFRHQDAEGFVRLWGLGVATWSAVQEKRGAPGPGAAAAGAAGPAATEATS